MRLISEPTLERKIVFLDCVNSISVDETKHRLLEAEADIMIRYTDYKEKATASELYLLPSSEWGNEEQIVISAVSKKDLTSLYTKYFAGEGSVGRSYYDSLKVLAPLGKCPYCGFGQVSTLDHFLAKSRYPTHAILPWNLVPSCSDCNKGKGSSILTHESQGMHPYFESNRVEIDSWLRARVCDTAPVTVEYWIDYPPLWPNELHRRLKNHFEYLNLGPRFAVEAATEIAGLITTLDEMPDNEDKQAHLATVARRERKTRPNTWKAALYDGLKDDNWYIGGGYSRAAT